MNETTNNNPNEININTVEVPNGGMAAVAPVPEKPFIVSRAEILFALLSYAAAYLYVWLFFNDLGRWDDDPLKPVWAVLPIMAFAVAAVLILNRKKKATAESWFWLACLLAVTAAFTFRIYTVWNEAQLFLFVHGLIVWWVLARSGKLLDGESGHFLPVDGLNGFFVIPFYHYFLRIRTWAKGLGNAVRGTKGKKQSAWWIAGALLISLLLFTGAVKLLMQADSTFAKQLEGLTDWLKLDEETILYLIFSLPAGAYIYGLIGGSARYEDEKLLRQRYTLSRFLGSIRRVPAGVWAGVILLFSVLYVAFFALQASYFLGAFTHTLPEGFIVSQYARKGFFELCRVMAINFVLLWLVTRMSEAVTAENEKSGRLLKISCLLLLIESLLFAVIAASKIALYVSNFGWTAKRIQSLWMVGVLAAACIAWAVHLMSGKKTMKLWMMLSAGTLSALAFLPV